MMTTRSSAPAKRRKRPGPEVREEALVVARRLLLERGPHAVTLANVGDDLGMTHANVLYHFGSAAGLQMALMESMIKDLTAALDHVVETLQADAGALRTVVDRVFDAFAKGGAGPLAAWIILSGNTEHLKPVRDAVHSLVKAIVDQATHPDADSRVRSIVLLMTVTAFGDAVIGPHIRDMLDAPDDAMRDLTTRILPYFLLRSDAPPAAA